MSTVPFQIQFFAPGIAAPQGSKTRTRWGMRESSQRVGPWRDAVEQAATQAMEDEHMLGPLSPPYRVTLAFLIKKPRTTRAKEPVAPTIGDIDKLARSTHDALTSAGLIEDDRFIVLAEQSKRWAAPGENAGAWIVVAEAHG